MSVADFAELGAILLGVYISGFCTGFIILSFRKFTEQI